MKNGKQPLRFKTSSVTPAVYSKVMNDYLWSSQVQPFHCFLVVFIETTAQR